MDLTKRQCAPCEGGTKPFNSKEIKTHMGYLTSEWKEIGKKSVKKTFELKNFKEAMRFVNKIAKLAENEHHHPDISIYYNKVVIKLWTHAIGGLSVNDFILARKIEELI